MRGPASAPPVIRDALHSDSANSFCEVLPLEPVLTTYRDFGNVSTDEANPSNDEPIRTAVTGVLDSGLRPLILGGDHAISYPVIAALRAWRLQNQQHLLVAPRDLLRTCPKEREHVRLRSPHV